MITMQSGAICCRISCDSGERIFCGWCTGTPAASPVSLTGENETCMPRPLGRSGWVIIAAISKSGWVRRCSSVGTANRGVPQNTTFIGTKRLPFAEFPHFLDFALDQVALEHAEVLDEKDAVEVIDFVAERARQQILAANLERFACNVDRKRTRLNSSHLGIS